MPAAGPKPGFDEALQNSHSAPNSARRLVSLCCLLALDLRKRAARCYKLPLPSRWPCLTTNGTSFTVARSCLPSCALIYRHCLFDAACSETVICLSQRDAPQDKLRQSRQPARRIAMDEREVPCDRTTLSSKLRLPCAVERWRCPSTSRESRPSVTWHCGRLHFPALYVSSH